MQLSPHFKFCTDFIGQLFSILIQSNAGIILFIKDLMKKKGGPSLTKKVEQNKQQKVNIPKKVQKLPVDDTIKKTVTKIPEKASQKNVNKIEVKKIQKQTKPKIEKGFIKQQAMPPKGMKPVPNKNVRAKPNIKLIKPVQQNKKVVAVIVSLMNGSSYDHLFTSVQQKAEEGTQVLVYSCNSNTVQYIVQAFNNEASDNEEIKKLMEHIKMVDPDCVVFNWECCSFYGSKTFPQGKKHVFDMLKIIIEKGYMAMFSDFSLKALIAQWDQPILGPNPFVSVSQYGGDFTLCFNCEKLKDCPSAQLQIVGDMAVEGHCNVSAMGGTIVFGVNPAKSDNDAYKLEVLTVVTSLGKTSKYQSEIGEHKGMAGHVVLTYKTGANILVSMGHWIQLMKIDTSEKVLFEVAARQYGEERMKSMKMEYESLDEVQKKSYIMKNAVEFVKSSAPCKNMSKKAKKAF